MRKISILVFFFSTLSLPACDSAPPTDGGNPQPDLKMETGDADLCPAKADSLMTYCAPLGCVDIMSSSQACGSCTNKCPDGQACKAGKCDGPAVCDPEAVYGERYGAHALPKDLVQEPFKCMKEFTQSMWSVCGSPTTGRDQSQGACMAAEFDAGQGTNRLWICASRLRCYIDCDGDPQGSFCQTLDFLEDCSCAQVNKYAHGSNPLKDPPTITGCSMCKY